MASLLTLLVMSFAVTLVTVAADPDVLQDICVADLNSQVKVNGFPCKANICETDFFSDLLTKQGNTSNMLGSSITMANVEKVPGLNTLGIAMARIDFAAGGLNPPHIHPRASEVLYLLQGTLEVGFVTTANQLITKTLKQGEMFVFPKGLVHYQRNTNEQAPAAALVAFNSQLPGTQAIAAALFTAKPVINNHVIGKTFQVGTKEVEKLKYKLSLK